MTAQQGEGLRLDVETQFRRRAHGAQQPRRILREAGGGRHADAPRGEVALSARGVQEFAFRRERHGVERKIARGQVPLQGFLPQTGEVEGDGRVGKGILEDGAGGIAFGVEQDVGAVEGIGDAARQPGGVTFHGEIPVVGRASQEQVAHRAADEPHTSIGAEWPQQREGPLRQRQIGGLRGDVGQLQACFGTGKPSGATGLFGRRPDPGNAAVLVQRDPASGVETVVLHAIPPEGERLCAACPSKK